MNASSKPRPRAVIVIPARLASTRLPRKLLLRETGRSLLEHTHQAASGAELAERVIVATDSLEIFEEVLAFGGTPEMTSCECTSGTDRVAEVARRLPQFDIFVNVQGDEPELKGEFIDRAVELLLHDRGADMATLATPIRTVAAWEDRNCVKVVCDRRGRALYFSRSPIPAARQFDASLLSARPSLFHQHIGLYAYRRDYLLQLSATPPTPLEKLEKLEQLRALETGATIAVDMVAHPVAGIDTPADYRAFVARRPAG